MDGLEQLDRLAERAGIESFYWDIWGQQHFATEETKRALLEALKRDGRSAEVVRIGLTDEERENLRALGYLR